MLTIFDDSLHLSVQVSTPDISCMRAYLHTSQKSRPTAMKFGMTFHYKCVSLYVRYHSGIQSGVP